MTASRYKPSAQTLKNARISPQDYEALYKRSLTDPDGFWGEQAKRLEWFKAPTTIKNTSFDKPVSIRWYEDGVLNAAYNCIDRHLPEKENDVALIWEGDSPDQSKKITYGELLAEVSRLANALKSLNVKKGDRVILYMPMILEAVYAMLACARIGAVHSVVFGGFSPDSLKDRIQDCGAKVILTSDESYRGGKTIPLKANVDEALKHCPGVKNVLVYTRTASPPPLRSSPPLAGGSGGEKARDLDWETLVQNQSTDCPCEPMNAEDPLFILYTSGSTGKPKGVLHSTAGYLVYTGLTHEAVFDYRPGEIYWCTADIGWVTGHSYIVYGPLCNGATSLVFEGVPNYPDWSRFWQVVDKHKVNIFYTAPTAIRSLIKAGDEFLDSTTRESLRILGTVGEPINHEAWMWYYEKVGGSRCPVIDTWWQTETGGHLITPLPCHDLKPGSASLPFFGIEPVIVDGEGKELKGTAEGNLCIGTSWPGQMRTIYGDHERFEQTYFSTFPGLYFTGDGARRDEDGYYWITGRVDDVINVSGHRLGTAEIESAIDEHEAVAEAAVVGFPHDIKGQGIYAYVTLVGGFEPSEEMKKEIVQTVRKIIGPIASPDVIHWAQGGLPKTRSGKIMRRILRKIAAGELDSLGDTSTLADPGVVEELIKG